MSSKNYEILKLCGTGVYKYIPEEETNWNLSKLRLCFDTQNYMGVFLKINYKNKDISIYKNGTIIFYNQEKTEAMDNCKAVLGIINS
jgi:hypothetical protein